MHRNWRSALYVSHTLLTPAQTSVGSSWEPSKAAQDRSFRRASLRLYRKGRGVPQDIVQAYKWYSLAATNEDKPANELRNTIANQMTPAQIAEAQKLAQEWKPKGK